ncbi:MAG TPA: histidine kinase [Actinomycetota bacterium]|nr:histidine kinase [Actinomycetota bacterium]
MAENVRGLSSRRSTALEARHVEALRETVDQLRAEVADLRASRERIVLAADADRRRIERDLHESVRQHLVALAVNLQRAGLWIDADPAAARELLEEMGRDVQQALDETGELAQRIYPALLDARDLAAALRSAAMSAGIPASVDVPAVANRPPEITAAVYLCCLEALEQVGAGARATVTVRDEEGAIGFEVVGVAEDGAASEDAALPDGELGRLRDRVEALGGRLRVRSEDGRIIRVSGVLPLPR